MTKLHKRIVATFTVGLVIGLLGVPHASAQNLDCLNCDVEVRVLEWNGTAAPGKFVGGTFRVENTGESADTYDVMVAPTVEGWIVEADVQATEELAAGSGVFADTSSNTQDIAVTVLIPEGAQAGDESGITLTVTSQNDDTVTAQAGEAATASQIYAWSLACTPRVEIQKTQEGAVTLDATNTGNGADGATIVALPLNGLTTNPPETINAAAGATVSQDIDLGIGLSLEDGEYVLRWDLASTNSPSTTATCSTTLVVTGGTPSGGGDGGDSEESPAPTALVPVMLLALLARLRRRGTT